MSMNAHNRTKSKVSDDEALAVFALTQLDRGTLCAATCSGNDKNATTPPPPSQKPKTARARTSTPMKKPASSTRKIRTGLLPNAVTIQTIPKHGNYVNHSYTDFSLVPNDQNYQLPASLDDMTFAEKLHVVLLTAEYQSCISWLPHGRAFRVNISILFEKTACPKFFAHKRFSSFLRQLNNHGFKHLTSGPSRNGYYHECFVRGLEHIAQYMPRAKDARRHVPDPDNEPDFDEITRRYPLPDVTLRIAVGDTAMTTGDEDQIRSILQAVNPKVAELKPKARTFDAMMDGTCSPTLERPPASKKAALLPFPPPPAVAFTPNATANLWAVSLRNQQVMEQLQFQQQQFQQMISRMQQGDAAEQLLRSLYNL